MLLSSFLNRNDNNREYFVAGNNKIIKQGQSLFKEGDSADSMYIVRRGELQVYLQKAELEVNLAVVKEGGIVGEMAFFDQKPRSASVKANSEAEVTVISKDDFGKLMKQIPKWFVTLMGSLSSRLRQTNERLQKVESLHAGATEAFENSTKLLYVIGLLWHKDGVKTGKDWHLNAKEATKELATILRMPPEKIEAILKLLCDQKIIDKTQDQYKNVVYSLKNRGDLERITQALSTFAKSYPNHRQIPSDLVPFIECIAKLSAESAYDTITVSLDDIKKKGLVDGFDVKKWDELKPWIAKPGEVFAITKISGGEEGVRVDKKEVHRALISYKIIIGLSKLGAP